MEEGIKQIAERLRGLREVLNITADDVAKACGIEVEKYLEYESGKADMPVSLLHNISHRYGIELSVLLTGEDPHMHQYSLTRKNKGENTERCKAYKYQALANGFINRKAEPFLVTACPKPEGTKFFLNFHPGQEFNYILKGRMKLSIGGKEMILGEGDSIYFNSGLPHGMLALDGKECRFLAIIF